MNPSAVAPSFIDLQLLEAMPGNSILLLPNAPIFTIIGATEGYYITSGRSKEELTGKGMFEAFPAPPDDPEQNGVKQLRASLELVLDRKTLDPMPLVRYDIENADGSFGERWWSAVNKPVISEGQVAYILHTAEDITAQIKAEKREVQIEGIEKVFGLFMHAPMVVGLVDGDDYVLEMANNEAFKLWGKGPDQIIGKPLLQGVPELKGQGIIELFDQVRASGEPYIAHEVPVDSFVNGQKEQHYFNLVYQPYYSRNSTTPTGVFTISHDVSEQVKARQKAEESETKFRTMAESTPVLIAVGDETGNVTYFNSAWTQLTGKPTGDLLKSGWADLVYADDREPFIATFQDAFTRKEPFSYEFRMLDAQEDMRWLLAHCVPRFDSADQFRGYIGACTDITEHKKVQNELQTALEQVRLSKEAAELGTFDMDLGAGTMHWDDRCRTLFGISHHNKVTYENDFVKGLHPDDRDRILKVINDVFIKSISNGDYDVEYRTVGAEDGVIRWVRAKGKVYFNEQDRPVRFIGSVLDITEQVTALQRIETLVEERTRELAEANTTLQNINKELQRSNQNLEEFAHAASHDLKEPVRKIHFFTNQLKDQLSSQLTEGQTGAFHRIEKATQRMGNLIDDLLIYSHVSHRPVDMETVDLNVKVQNVLEDLELNIAEKGAVIHVDNLPEVRGYKRQLQQLFHNLISNALKYSKKEEAPRIRITAALVEHEGEKKHQLSVTDNGIGFELQYADKIFQMFSRLHGKSEYSGTGVGLSIVKKVVENHNGFIKVESEPGVGSTFHVFLPA